VASVGKTLSGWCLKVTDDTYFEWKEKMDMGLGELWELVMDSEAWRAAISWSRKESDMTEQLN